MPRLELPNLLVRHLEGRRQLGLEIRAFRFCLIFVMMAADLTRIASIVLSFTFEVLEPL